MASRLDYYFRQRVTEAELDLGFELLEQADRALASDIGLVGIVSGAVPTPHDPVADLTLDLTGPARGYDKLGQRIFVGTASRVNLAVDAGGVPTEVTAAGEERWLAVFLRFDRLLSDPRLDGTSREVFFRRDESFVLFVRQGDSAPAGRASRVPLEDDALLVCDMRLEAAQTQILASHIDTTRRQAFVFAKGSAIGVDPSAWTYFRPAVPTVQASLDVIDAQAGSHLQGGRPRHGGTDIDQAPTGFLTGRTLGALFDELVAALVAPGGAARIGLAAIAGAPRALAEGTVRVALERLLGWLNEHVGAATNAHPASAISATAHGFVQTRTVQAQLAEMTAGYAAPQGAEKLGWSGASGNPRGAPAGTVQQGMQAIVDALSAHSAGTDHDLRYPRRVFARAEVVERGQTRELGTTPVIPAFLTMLHATVDANGQPTGPLYLWSPSTIQINCYVRKDTDANRVFVQNTSAQRIYVFVNAFAF